MWHQAEKLATLLVLFGTYVKNFSWATLSAAVMSYGIPRLRSNSHLAHSLGTVCEIAYVQATGWIMVVPKLNGSGVEVEI